MSSRLVISPARSIDQRCVRTLKLEKKSIVFVSLNKPYEILARELAHARVPRDRVFAIDCVSTVHSSKDAVYVSPRDVDLLAFSLEEFSRALPSGMLIVFDSLATLLLYNDVNKVADFARKLAALSSREGVDVVAFSPKTSEDLLEKISGFFDAVEGNA